MYGLSLASQERRAQEKARVSQAAADGIASVVQEVTSNGVWEQIPYEFENRQVILSADANSIGLHETDEYPEDNANHSTRYDRINDKLRSALANNGFKQQKGSTYIHKEGGRVSVNTLPLVSSDLCFDSKDVYVLREL